MLLPKDRQGEWLEMPRVRISVASKLIMKIIQALILMKVMQALVPGSFGEEFKFTVLVDGQPADEYQHDGRTFIEGKPGSEFTLKFENRTAFPVLILPSVDGLSTIDGKAASPEDGGYVVGAFETYEIKGWRTSLNDVRKFNFTAKGNNETYLEQLTGSDQNCGVIGLKVIRQRQPLGIPVQPLGIPVLTIPEIPPTWTFPPSTGEIPPNWQHPSTTEIPLIWPTTLCSTVTVNGTWTSSANVVNTSLESGGFDLGTKMGQEIQNMVHEITFSRGEEAANYLVYYATGAGLRELGVIKYPMAFNAVQVPQNPFCKVPQQ
jgi:hypothetical protein